MATLKKKLTPWIQLRHRNHGAEKLGNGLHNGLHPRMAHGPGAHKHP